MKTHKNTHYFKGINFRWYENFTDFTLQKKKSIYLFVKLNTREFFSFEMILDYSVARVI